MIIYGVAALAACHLAGVILGDLLGVILGVQSNVGGVGFAMLLLIVSTDWLRRTGRLPQLSEQGILFWSAMYIPIVVAMAAQQNVVAALAGGPIAIIAGVGATIACVALVPVVARIGGQDAPLPPLMAQELSDRLSAGRLHGSAVAIIIGLVLAWLGGLATGGSKGLADVPLFAGIGLMGGAMLRDLAIVSTAYGVDIREIRKAGAAGVVSLALGIFVSFAVGALVAAAFGYTDAVSMATIGGGAATYIVGPVTGTALGASSEVIALSVAAGLLKAVLVMIGTPFVAPLIGLNNPKSAMAYGGLMGTTSGVAGGLAATDKRLVPYGAMTATFYTGLGCLMGPSVIYLMLLAVTGS
ncbi:hypothetical protein PLESTB_001847100 [Pleodorina starrii]|uniref:Malonate/sodium symporter MadM subunit N-terminal domain-containing protein n=1 Tax=Pleodorina starrii TaxID=330485 RepID=A0A9W6FAY5_9CHLO|nr:hypothetical protein PLESTB_001847100 [Pleodorina starrii]